MTTRPIDETRIDDAIVRMLRRRADRADDAGLIDLVAAGVRSTGQHDPYPRLLRGFVRRTAAGSARWPVTLDRLVPLLLVVALLIAFAAMSVAGPGRRPLRPLATTPGLVVVVRDGVIFTIDPITRVETVVAHRLGAEGVTTNWSADGRRIVTGDGYAVAADGSNERTALIPGEGYGTWSPTADRFAVAGIESIRILGDGGALIRSLPLPSGVLDVQDPITWSPDGTRIAFDGCAGGPCLHDQTGQRPSFALWVLGVDGSSARELVTASEHLIAGPTWSPDGRRIAFWGERCTTVGRCASGIWVVSADGGDPVQVSPAGDAAAGPVWSPDGTSIVYAGGHIGEPAQHVFVVDVDRGAVRQLSWSGSDVLPVWSADGSLIAFGHVPAGGQDATDVDVWVMGSDGSSPREIATGTNNFDFQHGIP